MKCVFAFFLGLALMLASASAVYDSDDFAYHGPDYVKSDVVAREPRAATSNTLYQDYVDAPVNLDFMLENTFNQDRANIPSSIDLFFLIDEFVKAIGDMPSNYPRTYQVSTQGLVNATFKMVWGSSYANVTETGLITAKEKTGTANISLTTATETFYIAVNVTNYADIYVDNKINTALADIIKDGQTELEKLTNITAWVARNTDYSVSYSSWGYMMIYMAGDCWASSYTIVEMARRIGLNASVRRANQDEGAGSGHRNVLCIIDGIFYIADAGYDGKKPRGYSIETEPEGFLLWGNLITQYDGFNSTVRIPHKIGNVFIRGIGRKQDTAVFMNSNLEALYIPHNITSIAKGCLYKIEGLKTIVVDPENPMYETVDNVLYTKNRTTLLLAPRTLQSLTIDRSTVTLGRACCTYMNISSVVIPSSVRNISMAAFFQSQIDDITIEDGVEKIGETVFKYTRSNKVVLPDTVKSMDNGTFYFSYVKEVVLSKNCPIVPAGTFQQSYVYKAIFPYGIRVIGGRCFYNSVYIENVTLPTSLRSIELQAFSSPRRLKDIFYEGTEELWNKINIVTNISSGIKIHFLNLTSSESWSSEPVMSSSSYKPVVVSSSSNKPVVVSSSSSKPVVVSSTSSVSNSSYPPFVASGMQLMGSSVLVLLSMCLVLLAH